MSNRFRVAFREKLCAGPPSLWCICCCCFCCVKDFEKRSQQTPVFCRNSNSHSSVRSCVSYHKTGLITNNNRPRTLAVDYNQKLGVTLSCVRRDQEEEDLMEEEETAILEEELDKAIRPEIEKLVEKERGSDCINCTNCSLLFPPRPKAVAGCYETTDRTSTTELSQSEPVEKVPLEVIESLV
ncbi:g_PROTEIN_RECEP_F1_2 domain-containing protein [Trichonephila inaurata madagascariensis]|uniref:G_PROTEIN_RECEP_F1_2 domain-containing protein n=1 Tax=Trichonephila inaurata madagascariensis TaxID=2747483 RepID=A0A8X6Y2S3_9ARAC|nr:g_PROTEIN_RECEP_F1_2 domain-containing protein [Trichonephila inaurata madagascariensis]